MHADYPLKLRSNWTDVYQIYTVIILNSNNNNKIALVWCRKDTEEDTEALVASV